jgi:hypothetical protein
MNSRASNNAARWGSAAQQTEEEELETGEPIPEENEPAPVGKIPARRGKFGGGPPTQPKPSNSNDGQVVLATAKYLQRDPEPELRRAQEKRAAQEQGTNQSVEGSVFNGGVLGGVVAMMVAVAWFLAGLANDVIFFYPPILFVIGLGAFFKGFMRRE